jgi:hypothetical protein
MGKEKQDKGPVDLEYQESLLGQYETITGRDWHEIESLMKAGDVSATLIFVADHLIKKIESARESIEECLGEKLDDVWSLVNDLNAAAQKPFGQ